eukprot:554227_1
MPQLGRTDETVAVLIEHTEGFLDFLLGVSIVHLSTHQSEELWKVDGTRGILIDFVDHVLQLRLGGVLPQRAHDGAEFLGGDGAVPILVEQGEGLLELSDLLVGQLVGHWGESWGNGGGGGGGWIV